MGNTMPQDPSIRVLREINLGQHHLVLMSNQSIEIMRDEQVPSVADTILGLDSGETYRLMICLKEMFKETCE